MQGGRDIVAGGGDLGHSLFAAASGIANLSAAQAELADEAQKLFLPSARVREINKSVAEFNKLNKQIKECLLPTARWREHDRALSEAQKQRDDVRQKIQSKTSRITLLERIVRALPLAAQRQQMLADLTPLLAAPLLAEDFAEQRRQAATALAVAMKAADGETEKVAQLDESLRGLQVPADVLQHAQAISQLQERLGSHRKAMDDRRLRVAERSAALAAAQSRLQDLGRADLQLDEAEQLRLTADQRVRIQDLGNKKGTLVERAENARANLTELQERSEEVGRQLEACPPTRDTQSLRTALAEAREDGPLEKQLEQLQADEQEADRNAQAAMRRLHGWSRSLDELEQAALPADETVDRFEQELNAARQEVASLREKWTECQNEAHGLDEQIERLRRRRTSPRKRTLSRRGPCETKAGSLCGGNSPASQRAMRMPPPGRGSWAGRKLKIWTRPTPGR